MRKIKKEGDIVAFQKILCEGLQLHHWVDRANEPLTKHELDAVRLSARRGRPLGDDGWVEAIARRFKSGACHLSRFEAIRSILAGCGTRCFPVPWWR